MRTPAHRALVLALVGLGACATTWGPRAARTPPRPSAPPPSRGPRDRDRLARAGRRRYPAVVGDSLVGTRIAAPGQQRGPRLAVPLTAITRVEEVRADVGGTVALVALGVLGAAALVLRCSPARWPTEAVRPTRPPRPSAPPVRPGAARLRTGGQPRALRVMSDSYCRLGGVHPPAAPSPRRASATIRPVSPPVTVGAPVSRAPRRLRVLEWRRYRGAASTPRRACHARLPPARGARRAPPPRASGRSRRGRRDRGRPDRGRAPGRPRRPGPPPGGRRCHGPRARPDAGHARAGRVAPGAVVRGRLGGGGTRRGRAAVHDPARPRAAARGAPAPRGGGARARLRPARRRRGRGGRRRHLLPATKSTGGEDRGYGALVGVPVGGLVGLIGGAVAGANTGGRWAPASLPGPAAPRTATTPPGAPAPGVP
jgi:hypothetical protein